MSHHSLPAGTARRAAARVPGEGLFAHLVRLWLDHHRRIAEYGVRPL